MLAAYIRPDGPVDVGRIFERFLMQHVITKQEAAYDLGIRDEAVSRAIQGTGPLDLWALSRWPVALLADFVKRILIARVDAETKSVAKAALPEPVTLKRSA